MSFDLDHVFVAASFMAPEIRSLVDAGFTEGPAHDHPGQGTASRGIFFENAYLELIWLTDADAATTPPVERTGLAQRVDPRHPASPFGIGLRSALDPMPAPPFDSWGYSPAYLPDGFAFAMATTSEDVDEPLVFVIPWSRRASWEVPEHPNGARRMTRVVLAPDTRRSSRVMSELDGLGLVFAEDGAEPMLRIELDDRTQGAHLDLRPQLPLFLAW